MNGKKERLSELEFRLHRVESALIKAQLRYKLALLANHSTELLEDLTVDLENLKRKISWFKGAISKYILNGKS